jgi:hypothetical protein
MVIAVKDVIIVVDQVVVVPVDVDGPPRAFEALFGLGLGQLGILDHRLIVQTLSKILQTHLE